MRLPDPIANTTTEAYLAYKAGVLNIGDLKPSLYDPYLHYDAWLAYWAGLTDTYPIHDVGKNLFNEDDVVAVWINESGAAQASVTWWQSKFIPVLPNTTYTVTTHQIPDSGSVTSQIQWHGYSSKEESSFISGQAGLEQLWGDDVTLSMTFTTSSDCHYVRIGYRQERQEMVQLEEGSTATAYEPYTGTPEMLTDEEALVAYLSGVTNTYPEEYSDPIDARITGYLRYLVSARFGRPDYPVNNIEFYLSLMKPPIVTNDTPSSNIELDNTAWAELIDVKMYGDTEQDGTPTPDSPISVQTVTGRQAVKVHGKNLLDPSILEVGNITAQGVDSPSTLVVRSDYIYLKAGNYALKVNDSTNQIKIFRYVIYDTSKTFVLSGSPLSKQTTITMSADGYLRLCFYNDPWRDITVDEIVASNIQLESGSTATDFEPYQSQEHVIDLSSKNLLDPTTLIDGYVNGADGTVNSNHPNGEMCSSFIRVKPNTKYTVSIQATSSSWQQWFGIGEYKDCTTESFITRQSATTAPNSYYTITTNAGCNYVRVSGRNMKDATKIQFEEGDSVTAYEAFWEYKLCGVSDYKDRIYRNADGEWYLHNDIIELRFNGTENWVYDSTYNYFRCPTYPVPNMAAGSGPYQKNNYFTVNTDWGSFRDGDKDSIFTITQDGYRVCIRNNAYNTTTAFKTWLASAIPRSYFIIQTPTETQITNAALVAQLDALAAAKSYNDKTYITVEATDPNLPALLKVEAGEYR